MAGEAPHHQLVGALSACSSMAPIVTDDSVYLHSSTRQMDADSGMKEEEL